MNLYIKALTVFLVVFSLSFNVQAGNRLEDKVAIITGGSKGIGKGIAKVFASEGAKVIILSRNKQDLEAVVKQVSDTGGEIAYIVGDITKPEDMEKMASETAKKYGKIDILIHNAAGIFPPTRVEDMTEEEWHKAIHTNLDGTFYAVKSVIPYMKKQNSGRIVLTSSISGPRVGLPTKSHYTASKGGMNGFMKTIAIELAKYNITVNAVEPGNIETEGLAKANSQEVLRQRVEPIPMKRLGTPEEVAYAHLFLASDEARYITGQSIIVDGGQTLPEAPGGFSKSTHFYLCLKEHSSTLKPLGPLGGLGVSPILVLFA